MNASLEYFSKTLAFPPEGCVLSCVKIKVDTSRMSGAPTFVSIKSSLKSVIITNIFLHMYILCMLLQIKMPVICPKVCTRVSLLGHWGFWHLEGLALLPVKWKKFREIFDFVLISRIFSKTVGNNCANSKTSLVVFTKNFKNRAKFLTSKLLSKANYYQSWKSPVGQRVFKPFHRGSWSPCGTCCQCGTRPPPCTRSPVRSSSCPCKVFAEKLFLLPE